MERPNEKLRAISTSPETPAPASSFIVNSGPSVAGAMTGRVVSIHSLRKEIRVWTRDLLIAIGLALVIIVFLYQPVKVEGTSMAPLLSDQERIFINKFVYRFEPIQRGDVVVFWYPLDRTKSFIKRVVGLPGETRQTIEDTIAYACEIDPTTIQVSIAAPYPGTALFRQAHENGWLAGNGLIDADGVQKSELSYPHLPDTEIRGHLVLEAPHLLPAEKMHPLENALARTEQLAPVRMILARQIQQRDAAVPRRPSSQRFHRSLPVKIFKNRIGRTDPLQAR